MIRAFQMRWLMPGFFLAFAGATDLALGGDILRGGAGAGAAAGRRVAESRALAGEAAAVAARVRANDRLARTTKAVNGMRALQQAARAAAGGGGIPNGLVPGGLDLDRVAYGAANPQQSGNTVTVRQNQAQALLEWKSFNVGRETTLNFDQSAGGADASKWIAFNRVTGASTAPSQILGRINAQGQVYVLNQNGVIFGAGSQVNARTLVASTLPINENLIQRGLLNNPDAQFLFSAFALDAGTKGPTPAFTPDPATLPDGSFGDIVVERGALITAPTSAEKVGGRVVLAGANVRNEGTISTPDGQTILAAGLQVGFAAHPTSDPTLRGLDVYIGETSYAPGGSQPPAGTAMNAGLIEAPRGSITIAGKTVRQLGVLESSTSTALNGRVDLLANHGARPNANHDFTKPDSSPLFYNTKTGLVELGRDSLIRILPEIGGKDRAVGLSLALPSIVNIQGRSVHLASGSTIHAPGASIPSGNGVVIPRDGSRDENRGRLEAGVGIRAGEWISTGLSSVWANSNGQVYLDSGAVIDVAGSVDVAVPMSHNLLTLQLRGAELANSPTQRQGAVRGTTITVDARRKGVWNGFAWVGTPLGDVSGYLGIIERTVGELTTAGGSVAISAGESVVMQPGSLIDVSGGTKRHAEGLVRTTRLWSNGHLIDIADATPDRIYGSIYTGESTTTHAKWGVTKTYRAALAPLGEYFQKSYVEGADAGSISITAPSMALDGKLVGRAVQGPRQVNQKTFSPAKNGSLALRFQKADPIAPQFSLSPTPPSIRFSTASSLPAVAAFALDSEGNAIPLGAERKSNLVLSPELLEEEGFGTLLVDNSEGDITIPSGTPLEAPYGGSITLRAANLSIDSKVSAPGGFLDFTVFNISPFVAARGEAATIKPPTPPPNPGRGIFNLGPNGILSTAGLLVDNRPGISPDIGLPPVVNGGSISVSAYTVRLAPGSLVDVSGGLSIRADGKRVYGNGGSIAILGGRDPSLHWVLGGELSLGAQLSGYSRLKGGSLSLMAPLVRIGGGAALPPGVKPGEVLHLDPEFFSRGGFSSFSITGLGKAVNAAAGDFLPAISIAPGTIIRPAVQSQVSRRIRGVETFQPMTLPEGIRPPVDLAFLAPVTQDTWSTPSVNLLRGDIVVGAGARIETDPLAKVTLRGGTVSVLGSIIAPGGRINIAGAAKFPIFTPSAPGPDENNARPTVFLGPGSLISAAGKFVPSPDIYKWRLGRERQLGTVVPGGSIVVDGNIVAAAGAVLDVSGSSGIIDIHPSRLTANIPDMAGFRIPATSGLTTLPYWLQTVPARVDSDAGSLSLIGREMLFTDATLRGFAGGPSAMGGSLVVSSGRYIDPVNPSPTSPLDLNLLVAQSGNWVPAGFYPEGGTAIGRLVPVGDGDRGRFSVDRFSAGGFDSLKLSGTAAGAVGFIGDVSIIARRALAVAEGGVLRADGNVLLQAPYVALGTPFQSPVQIATSDADRLSLPGRTYVMPTAGTGILTVRASLIDIGNLSLQNIGLANFIAENGDIRGNGALNIAGTLNLRAGQIYPTTAGRFNIVAYDRDGAPGSGIINISGSGERPPPWSAGGILGIYASTIVQGGTLRAPFGTINLGWDGTGVSPRDYLSGAGLTAGRTLPVAQQIVLADGSLTSVSGAGLTIPYGINTTGETWIDPSGIDITGSGLPDKAVNLSAISVAGNDGAVIDVASGGDLFAHRWIIGNGGGHDILSTSNTAWNATGSYQAGDLVLHQGAVWSARRPNKGVTPAIGFDWAPLTESYAIVPGYGFDYSPYSAFNPAAQDPGYVDSRISVGDRIHIGPGSVLPTGEYTILPARYALLPGGVLITPKPSASMFGYSQTDGSNIVQGYRFNGLNPSQSRPALASAFEVASQGVFRERAQYEDFFANSFFPAAAERLGLDQQRLPRDSGRVVLSGLNALRFDGHIQGRSLAGGFGAEIDISTRANIVIGRSGYSVAPGTTLLDSAKLSSYGADSLLIGGTRSRESGGTRITVATKSLTVDNAGSPLGGPEILLASSEKLELKPGSSIVQSGKTRAGSLQQSTPILIGSASSAGSGNGLLVRASDSEAAALRSGVSSQSAQAVLTAPPSMVVGAGALISGAAITLDSTYSTSLDPSATLRGNSIGLNSGQIALAFDNPGTVPSIAGLVLSGAALRGLADTEKLSLLSYSTLDLYGTGSFGTRGSLALNAAQLRGFNNSGGALTLASSEILIGNTSGASALTPQPTSNANLVLNGSTVRLLKSNLQIGGFGTVDINAPSGLRAEGDGSLAVAGTLTIAAPSATATGGVYGFSSTGSMALNPLGTASTLSSGLGASLSFTGGTGLLVNTNISLPSGSISLRSMAGDLVIGTTASTSLDVGGTKKSFNDISRFTDGGKIELGSATGSIFIGTSGRLNVAADPNGGDAGSVFIEAPEGLFVLDGQLDGRSGSGGVGASFSLDTKSLASVGGIDGMLNDASFSGSRHYRIRSGNVLVDGIARATRYGLNADGGSITIGESGFIDASGQTGGDIRLVASGSVVLDSGARLSVAGLNFNSAGKGGRIGLEAGSSINGITNEEACVEIREGSTLDLSVSSNDAESASIGRFGGKLHLRAPQAASGTDLNITGIGGSIIGASSILAEGFSLFDLTGSGVVTDSIKEDIQSAGDLFGVNANVIETRILNGNTALAPVLFVSPGAEVINRSGDLVLGDANLGGSADWDLSGYRFGEKSAPGVLTLRAKGDVVFLGSLSDGFSSADYMAGLLEPSNLLPKNTQSWSYRIAAGSDFESADFSRTREPASASVKIGNPVPDGKKSQFIRTGSGDIEIVSSGDIQLLNEFATVYTAGTRIVGDALTLGGRFDAPGEASTSPDANPDPLPENFNYPAQYSHSGGSISLRATGSIERLSLSEDGEFLPDSQKQIPSNWLYRRGYVDESGSFGTTLDGEIASTTWWVDFSNFFQGIGALGGGMVSLEAGRNVSNVDAVVATNARVTHTAENGDRLARNQKIYELGGGDVFVTAGRNIDAGMYYVEKGLGRLEAGGAITTNPTRIAYSEMGFGAEDVQAALAESGELFQTLPTTLFLGKGSFDVRASGDIQLGPVLNPFLMPTGLNNSVRRKSYFSTYASDSSVAVSSMGGSVTLRNNSSAFGAPTADPIMKNWMEPIHLQGYISGEALSVSRPWLGLGESGIDLTSFERAFTLLPGVFKITALSGDVNLAGRFDLWPTPVGTFELVAAKNMNGLVRLGLNLPQADLPKAEVWSTAMINLSDASPSDLPTNTSPFGLLDSLYMDQGFLDQRLSKFFTESGSFTGINAVIQTQQALHGRSILRANDPEPLRIYSADGDISGLTLYSSKYSKILSGRDITDVAFYIQNARSGDLSLISSGRDIAPFNANTPSRLASRAEGNTMAETGDGSSREALAGDIQINGPGTLAVLAGRNLDLGLGANNADGTGVGLTSIGNARNPNLPFQGADIIAAAGIGPATSLHGALDFDAFIDRFVKGEKGAAWLSEVSSKNTNLPTNLTPESFDALDSETKARVALEVFYLVLRDSGRAKAESGDESYAEGFEAIDLLFDGAKSQGDILTRSRDIRTRSGGSISLLAPGGSLKLATSTIGSPLTPPGIVTEAGGAISIFTDGDVDIGISRIFTLRGGDQIIWSSSGDIAAGSSSKTVQSAPPTRVLIDPQSAALNVDLGGLATGGGIGVLASVEGVEPGNVDLIAPEGVVDAGDAGIRSTGNLNIAATQVLNADNISTGGSSAGVPTAPVAAAPNISGITAGSNTVAAANTAAESVAEQSRPQAETLPEQPSLITVEVLGYGGGDGEDEEIDEG
ncbi:MAG: filamentous hemagglutinin family protein [Verrucomicrobia bacterium]|nr:filamentous hemagglutinin family protein [Verrucomicrobiota bacterium]